MHLIRLLSQIRKENLSVNDKNTHRMKPQKRIHKLPEMEKFFIWKYGALDGWTRA